MIWAQFAFQRLLVLQPFRRYNTPYTSVEEGDPSHG